MKGGEGARRLPGLVFGTYRTYRAYINPYSLTKGLPL